LKKIGNIILVLMLLSSWVSAQKNHCVRKASFGKAEICLPKVKGYQECYMEPTVKSLADGTELPINMVLGYYLNNATYARKDSLGSFRFEDYFKVYGTKQVENFKADVKLLNTVEGLLADNFISKNWDAVHKEIDKIGLDIEIGTPAIIKKYKLNKHSFTYVIIATYEHKEVDTFTLAMTISGMLVEEKLVWMAYYLNYQGEETIAQLQDNSDRILRKLMVAKK